MKTAALHALPLQARPPETHRSAPAWTPAVYDARPLATRGGGDALLGHWLTMVSRNRHLLLERAARRLRLTITEWMALRQLQRMGVVTQCRLASEAGLTAPSLSRALASLEEIGCVTRNADAGDLRAIRVAITDDGRAMVERLLDTEREVDRKLFACLEPLAQEALADALRSVAVECREREA